MTRTDDVADNTPTAIPTAESQQPNGATELAWEQPPCARARKAARLVCDDVASLPDNLRELLLAMSCSFCSFNIEAVGGVITHYNGPRHQQRLSESGLPVGRVRPARPLELREEDGEMVLVVPPMRRLQQRHQGLVGEGAARLPDNLHELLLAMRCHWCSFKAKSVRGVFCHYSEPRHQHQLSERGLPVGIVRATGPLKARKEKDGVVLLVPPLIFEETTGADAAIAEETSTFGPPPSRLVGDDVASLPDNLRELLLAMSCSFCSFRCNHPMGALRHYNSPKHQRQLSERGLPVGRVRPARPLKYREDLDDGDVLLVPPLTFEISTGVGETSVKRSAKETSTDGPAHSRLVGEGAASLPDNLRELLLAMSCSFCSFKTKAVKAIVRHYNEPQHQLQLSERDLPVGKVWLTGPLELREDHDDETTLLVPPLTVQHSFSTKGVGQKSGAAAVKRRREKSSTDFPAKIPRPST